ncbi:MAG: hypothetical protein ABEH83_01295 [Halobacterium sp.]
MPSVRSALRVLLVVAGAALILYGGAVLASTVGEEGFPVGLAIGVGLLLVAAGGASLGGAALLSGESLRPVQRAALKLAGVLAVLAFVLPTVGFLGTPGLLFEWFGANGPVVAILAWFYLTLAALALAVLVALWRAAELLAARIRA